MWNQEPQKTRSLVVLAVGFSTLIALIAILGISAIQRAHAISSEMESIQGSYLETEAFRRNIANDMYLADILVRDYLLDPSPENAPLHRKQLLEIRSSLQQRLDKLKTLVPGSGSPRLDQLQREVQAYWDSLDPVFEWTAGQKAERSWAFLRHHVLPRRQAVVDLVTEIARLNRENLARERERTEHSRKVLRSFLWQVMAFTLGLGMLVAFLTTYRVAVLEKAQELQRRQLENTQEDLRSLSHRLVQAQEIERKSLSRELHDEVGQTLTALGIEIGNLEKLRTADPDTFRERIDDAKQLNLTAIRTIRDLAMGLRPAMLDDLGLEPALQWQGREFSRRTGVPATVQVIGELDGLSESQRTSIYRIVQEALTNCARHAQAKSVLLSVEASDYKVKLVVKDDGTGLDPSADRHAGLGLLGIQERVESLDGNFDVYSVPGQGTTLRAEIPVGAAIQKA